MKHHIARLLALLSSAAFAAPQLAQASPPGFPGAAENYRGWVFAQLPGHPEGLARDSQGRLHAVVLATGEVFRLDARGEREHYATIPSATLSRAGYSIGAAFDGKDNLYVAYFWGGSRQPWENDPFQLACRDSTDQFTGVYRVDAATRAVTPVLTKAQGWPVCVPDDLAIDREGNIYVTDLTLSGIWKIRANGSFVLWSADPLLQWPPRPYTEVLAGANPIALDAAGANVFVGTVGSPAVVRIPVAPDGTAGQAVVVARDFAPLDGLDVDPAGTIYVSEPTYDRIYAIAADGSRRVLIATAETAPISHPTSLVVADGVLCVTNFVSEKDPRPGTVACISGFRTPRRSHEEHAGGK